MFGSLWNLGLFVNSGIIDCKRDINFPLVNESRDHQLLVRKGDNMWLFTNKFQTRI